MLACDQIEERLSGYLDGELTQVVRQRVELHLDRCSDCRQKYDELCQLRDQIGKLSFGNLTPSERERIMNDVTTRTSRGLGWLAFIVGAVIIVAYGAYSFATDDAISALEKTAVAAMVVGLLLLFFSVARQRLIARKIDKYKDVEI